MPVLGADQNTAFCPQPLVCSLPKLCVPTLPFHRWCTSLCPSRNLDWWKLLRAAAPSPVVTAPQSSPLDSEHSAANMRPHGLQRTAVFTEPPWYALARRDSGWVSICGVACRCPWAGAWRRGNFNTSMSRSFPNAPPLLPFSVSGMVRASKMSGGRQSACQCLLPNWVTRHLYGVEDVSTPCTLGLEGFQAHHCPLRDAGPGVQSQIRPACGGGPC